MCAARGLSEILTITNDNQRILNNHPINNRESKSYQSRQLLDYEPIDQFGNYPSLSGSEVAQLSNDYENPRRLQMTARRRAANNHQNYYNQENVAPNYYNYPMSPNSRPMIKRWGLFQPATPVNNSSTTEKKNTTQGSTSSAENSDKPNLNSSTTSPVYPTPPEYPLIIKNRQVPVWQVPDDSLNVRNSINDPSSLYDAYDDGNFNPRSQENFNSPSNSIDNLKNNKKISGNSKSEQDKVKRGFRLVPVSRDLYLLREDNEPTPVDTNKQIPDLNNQRMINPKRSSLDLDDDRRERTSAMLAFKAHMHHNVRDIGKSFLQRVTKKDQLSSSSDFIADNQDLAYSPGEQNSNYNLYDPSIDSGSLQDNSNQIFLPQQQLEYSDPVLNSIGDDINFNNQIGSETGPIENLKLYENNIYESVDLPNYQSDTINPQGLYPVVQDDFYSPQLNQFSSPYKSNSIEKIEDSVAGENNELLERERGTREDSGVSSNDFNLAYLDKYAKAVDNLNENWDLNRDVENLGGNLVNLGGNERNSGGEINPGVKLQKSVEAGVNSGESIKQADYEKLNGTSLAMVIQPLTEQLQKLLLSIKQVNEKLMSDSKNSDDTILLDSLRKKRGVSGGETDDFDADDDDFDDEEFDDDVDDDDEDSRPERSDDSSVENESTSADKSSEKFVSRPSSEPPPVKSININKKITVKPSSGFQGNVSINTPKKSSLVNQNLNNVQKKRNNGIVSFFQKTLGIGTTTMTPQGVVNITWNSETMSTDSSETTTTMELHQQFIDSDYSQTSGSTKFEKTTATILPDTPAATNLIDEELTMPIEIVTQNNNPTTFKFSADVPVAGLTKSSPEITERVTEKIFKQETTENFFKNFETITTVVPEVRKNSSRGPEFLSYNKPSQGAHRQFSTVSSTTPGGEIETIKVAMMPVDDFSNKKSSYLNQLLRTNSTEILARLLPPEIIQNITSDGIIVKVPFSRNVKNNLTVKNQLNNSGKLLINPEGDKKIKGTRDEDAVVAVGDDDEDDSDTRLTIKLRLPNRSHSISRDREKIIRRNVDKKSGETVYEKSDNSVDGKSLRKRSEPVYEELDDDSFDSDDYDEDSLTNEEHETEKRDANEFDEYFEDQDDDEESPDDANKKLINSRHHVRPKKNQHIVKNQLKRADNIPGSFQNNSSNLPKIILRLRFPESPDEFSNSPESLSSSGLQRDARNFALKKNNRKIGSKRDNNVRIGRSLKSIDEEIEEEDENFFLTEVNSIPSGESERQLRVVRDVEDTGNNSDDVGFSTTEKIKSLPGTQEEVSSITVAKNIQNISSSVSGGLTTKALEKVEEKEAELNDDSTNVVSSTTVLSSSLRNGTTEAEEEKEEATTSTDSTTVTESETLTESMTSTDSTTNDEIIQTSTATTLNSNKIETTTLKKIESTVKSPASTAKSPVILTTIEHPETLTNRMEISSTEELKSTSMSVEFNSKITTQEPLTLVATVTAPTTLKNVKENEENQQEKMETIGESLNNETTEMLREDEKTSENFLTTAGDFLTSSSETGEGGSSETSGDMTTTSLEQPESSESGFSTLTTEKIEELSTEKIGDFTTEKIEELSIEKINFPTTTQLYVPSIALTTVGPTEIFNSENHDIIATESIKKITDSTIFSSSTLSMDLSTENLSTNKESTSVEENSTENNLQTKSTTVEIISPGVSSTEGESTVSLTSEFFPTEIKSTTVKKIISPSLPIVQETSTNFLTEEVTGRPETTQLTLESQSTDSREIISSTILMTKEELTSSLGGTFDEVSTVQVQEESTTEGRMTEKVSTSLMIESTTRESSTSSLASSSSSIESSAPPTESLTVSTSQIIPPTKSTTTEIIPSSSEADKTDENTTENFLSTRPTLESTEILTEKSIISSEKIDSGLEITTSINSEMSTTSEIEVTSTEKIIPESSSTEKKNLMEEIEGGTLSTTSGSIESTETTEKKFSESTTELLSSLPGSTSESSSSNVLQESTSKTESSTIFITTEKIIPTSTTAAKVIEITTPKLFGIISQSKETSTTVQEGKTSVIVGEIESSSSGISRTTELSTKIETSSEMEIESSSETKIESSSSEVTSEKISSAMTEFLSTEEKNILENTTNEGEIKTESTTENRIIENISTSSGVESTSDNFLSEVTEVTGTLKEETSTMSDIFSSSVGIVSSGTEENGEIKMTTSSEIPQVTESKSITPETIIHTEITGPTGTLSTTEMSTEGLDIGEMISTSVGVEVDAEEKKNQTEINSTSPLSFETTEISGVTGRTGSTGGGEETTLSVVTETSAIKLTMSEINSTEATKVGTTESQTHEVSKQTEETSVKISEPTEILEFSEGISTTSTVNNQNNFSGSTEESGSPSKSGSTMDIIETSTVEITEQNTTVKINETTYLSRESPALPGNETIIGATESLAPEEATRSTLSEVSPTLSSEISTSLEQEKKTESTLSSEPSATTIFSSTTEVKNLTTEMSTQGLEATNEKKFPTTTELFIPSFSMTTKKFIESTLSEIPTTVFNFITSTITSLSESTISSDETTLSEKMLESTSSNIFAEETTTETEIVSSSVSEKTTSGTLGHPEILKTDLSTEVSELTTLKTQSTTQKEVIEEPEVSTEAEGEEVDYETEVWTEENQTGDEENEQEEFEYEEESGGSTVKGQEFVDYEEDTTESRESVSSTTKKNIVTDYPGPSSSEEAPKSIEITEPFPGSIGSTEKSTAEISGGSKEPGLSSTMPGIISVSETTELGSSLTGKFTEITEKKLQSEVESKTGSTTLGLFLQNFTTDGSSVVDETTVKSLVVEVGKESETEGTFVSSGGTSGSFQTEKLSTEISTISGGTSTTTLEKSISTKISTTAGEFNVTVTTEETTLNTKVGISEGGLTETTSTGETTGTSTTRETSKKFLSTTLEAENNETKSIFSTNELNFENISSSSLGISEEEITVSTVSGGASNQSTELNLKEISSTEAESTESLEKILSTFESTSSVSEEKIDFSSTISSAFLSFVENTTTENLISLTPERQVTEKTTSGILETDLPTTVSVSTTLKSHSTTKEEVIEETEVSTEAEGGEVDYETKVWTEESQTVDEENEGEEFKDKEKSGGSTVEGKESVEYEESTTETREKISTTKNILTEKIDTSLLSSSTKVSEEFSSPSELFLPGEFTSSGRLSPVEPTTENIFKTTPEILPTTNILVTSEFTSTASVPDVPDLVGATLSTPTISSSSAAEGLSTELNDLTSAFPWETTKTERLTSVLAEFESNTETLSNFIVTPEPLEVIGKSESILIESTAVPKSTVGLEGTIFSSSLKPGENEIQVETTTSLKEEVFSTFSGVELPDVNKVTAENVDGILVTFSGDIRPAQKSSDELGIILITTLEPENQPKILQNEPTTEFLLLTTLKSSSTTPEQVIEIPVVQTESGTPKEDFGNEIVTEKIDIKDNEVTKVGENVVGENPSSTKTIDIIINPEDKIELTEDNFFTTKKLSNDEIKTSTESSGTSILAILSKGTIMSSPPKTSTVFNNLESTSVSSSTVINGLTDGLTKLTSLLPWITSNKPKLSSSTIENKNKNKPEYESTKSNIIDKPNDKDDVLSYANDKQKKKRLRLLGRLRELERKEEELIEREKELERRREKWEKDKNREKEKILKEEKNKKLMNNKGLGRDDDDDSRLEVLKQLEKNQEKLDDELERLVIKIEKKERDLEEKERILEINERKHEREREEFERQWGERNENNNDDDYGRRSGKIREEDDEKSDYVFDRNEENWKEKRPEEYDSLETTEETKKSCNKKKPSYKFSSPRRPNVPDDYQWNRKKGRFNSQINEETATKTICLDVVDENSQDGFKNNDYVTRVVCLPRENHPHSRKERKLLNLEYDDNEENYKLNCDEQDNLLVNQRMTTKTFDTTKKNSRNLETAMDFKLYFNSEGDGNSGGSKLEQDGEKVYDDDDEKSFDEREKRDGKTSRPRNPLGTEWPTEMTTKFYIRGTKELTSTTNKIISARKSRAEREKKNDYSADDYEDSDGEIGTTCFTMIIKNKKKNKNKKSSKCLPKRDLMVQVERPDLDEDESDDRWVNFKPNLRTIKSLGQSGDKFIKNTEKDDTELKRINNFAQNTDNYKPVKEKWPLYVKINNKEIIEISDFEIFPKEFPDSCKHNPQETFALYDFPDDNDQQLVVNPSEDDRERHNRWLWSKKKKKKRKKKKKHKSWISKLHRRLLSLDDKIDTNQFSKNSTSTKNSFSNSMDLDVNNNNIGRSLLALRSSKKKIRSKKSKLNEKKKLKKPIKNLKFKKKDRRLAKREVGHVDGKKKTIHGGSGPGKTKDLMGKVMNIIKPLEKRKLVKKASKKTTRSIIDKMKKVFNDVIGPEYTTTMKMPINLSMPEGDDEDDVEDYTEIIHHSAQLYEPRHGKRRPIDEEISGLSRLEDDEAHRGHQRHLGYHLKDLKNEGEDDYHHHDYEHLHEKSRQDKKYKNHKDENYLDRNDKHHQYHYHENRKKLSVTKEHPRSLKSVKKSAQHSDAKKNKIKVSGAKRNVLVENNSKQFNISSIITRVKNLIESQNLGSVEKIVVYVDKNNPGIGRKKKRQEVVEKKKKKEIDIPLIGRVKKNNNKFQLSNDEMYFDGDSLDEMISHVADKILKSVFDSQKTREILDPRLSIKVIQEVSNGTELPHEETKTEFMIDLSEQGLPIDKMNFKNNLLTLKSKKELHKNSARLTGKLTERKMNLPVMIKKKKRSNWRKKIKRQNIAGEIKNKLIIQLNKKLRSIVDNSGIWKVDKTKRKISGNSLEDFDVPLSHHVDDLDEKIRIMYALHQKKENKFPITTKKKRNHQISNHPRSKREGNLEFNNLDSKIFANENDKKSLRALIDQILNLQKNVNTTLEIIRKRINKDIPRNSTSLLTRKEKSPREFEKYLRPLKVEIRSSVKNKKLKVKSEKNGKHQEQKNKKKEHRKNKKNKLDQKIGKKLKIKEPKHSPKRSQKSKKKLNSLKNKKNLLSKKKKEQKSNAEERLDKMSRDIKSFLQREHDREPKKFDRSLSRINPRFKRRSLQALQYDDEPIDTDYPSNPRIGRHLCSKTPKRKSEKKKNKQKNLDKKLKPSPKKIKTKNSKKDKLKKVSKKNSITSLHKNSGLKNVTLSKIRIKKKAQQGLSLICDMDNVMLNLKKLLIHKNDLLDKISMYSCDKFIQIGDEIILKSSGVLGDILPRSRRELAEAKGLKSIKPGQLEDVLRQEQVQGHGKPEKKVKKYQK